ncbi:MAG: cupredoxin domain-containing protein [Thaumarchaeota archaeon]|nr:cupredoxin domain-containing protein [Nitrososphaerota archaeon]
MYQNPKILKTSLWSSQLEPPMSSKASTIVGAVVAILIVGAVASIGYYQVEVAPFQTPSTTTSTSASVSCPSSACASVSITSGAGVAPAGYTAGQTTTFGFSPDVVTVVIGVNNTVFWTNDDSAPHTATSNTGAFDSGSSGPLTSQGGTYQFTFTTAGTYYYHCSFHSWMQGKVIVLAGSATGASTSASQTSTTST